MNESIRRRFEKSENAHLTWDPESGGKRAFVCFVDNKVYDLGPDRDRVNFNRIADRMISGHYYPEDAVRFYGRFEDEGRRLQPGDRILQRALIFRIFHAWSMVQLFAAQRTNDRCRLGYVTTAHHHGRGVWEADLRWESERLTLRVRSIASPRSWLFWLGLPVGRYLQLRARRRAVEVFRGLCRAEGK